MKPTNPGDGFMATITVQCPTCDSELELDAAHRGQEVECGSCHQVFVAKPARADRDDRREVERPRKKSSAPRRRPRRYEDDDDYDDDYYERRRREKETGTGLGDASLIIGVVAVFVFWCPVIGIPLTLVGLILGGMGLRSAHNGTAIAGLVLNILFMIGAFIFFLMWGFVR